MQNQIDQLVLLNGGFGKRVKSISKQKPKCLIKFKKKSFLYWQLNMFRENGIKEVIICAGYKNQFISQEIKKLNIDNLKIKIIKENYPLGTGGAIKNCKKSLKNFFYVTYGDSWLNLRFSNLKKKFLKSKSKNIITVIDKKKIKNHQPNILIKNNKVIDYCKNKENYNFIDYGLMIFNRTIFNKIKKKRFDLSYIINKLISSKSTDYYKVKSKFYEIGSLKGIKEFKEIIK